MKQALRAFGSRMLAACALALTAGHASPSAGIRDASALLHIDAVAVDRQGMPVADLKPEEIEVWIGGYRVPIETLSFVTPKNGGRELVLLLDDLTVNPALLPRAKEAARRLVTRMVPGDHMAIVTLSGTSLARTDDRTRLLRIVDGYFARATGVVPIVDLSADFLRTLAAIAARMVELPAPRKTIVGIGSAWLLDTPIPPPGAARDVRAEWTDAMRGLALARAAFYVVDAGGVGSVPAGYATDGFAQETGGHAFVNTNDLAGAADRIMREASQYYVIGIADPRIHLKSDLRELDVRVLRRGVTVRARRAIPGRL